MFKSNNWSVLYEKGIYYFFFCSAAITIIINLMVILVLCFEAINFFSKVPLSAFFLDTQWTPLFENKHFGIWSLISGTLLVSFIAICVALPFGLMAAIHISEFSSNGMRKILKPILEILAGIPTIVYGYFALTFVTPLLQNVIPGLSGFNALSPGIVMGIMIIPMISSLSEDALYSVPLGLKEGGFALGASRLSVLFKVSIPSASSGIIVSIILALSRAIGETMIVAVAAGQQPRLTYDPRVPIETMTAYIVQVALGDVPINTIEYNTIFVVGATLFLITLCMNVVSHRIAKKFRNRI